MKNTFLTTITNEKNSVYVGVFLCCINPWLLQYQSLSGPVVVAVIFSWCRYVCTGTNGMHNFLAVVKSLKLYKTAWIGNIDANPVWYKCPMIYQFLNEWKKSYFIYKSQNYNKTVYQKYSKNWLENTIQWESNGMKINISVAQIL